MSESLAGALRDCLAAGEAAALVRVAGAKGSTPREAGASMLVTAARTIGTVGGGRLEWEAAKAARALLDGGRQAARLDMPLGPELGQCCGGHVTLTVERAGPSMLAALEEMEAAERQARPAVLVFGAGHTGTALVRALSLLPYDIRWIDEREGFPGGGNCLAEIAAAPADAAYVVLTHSHGLDALICAAVLEREDFAYLGVIGSKTKRRQFERGFRATGIADATIARLTCPIGGNAVRDKRPEIIAALVAAELVTVLAKAGRLAAMSQRGQAA